MTLYKHYRKDEKVVYSTTMNGKSFFFFKGFNSADEAKQEILSHYNGFEKVWFETFLTGEWSEIIC